MGFPVQFPPALKPGDRLLALAPSGCLRENKALEQGLALWRKRGYRVDLAKTYSDRWGYLAGTDAQRRETLAQGWQNPDYAGILCIRGGWGAARLLESWQWPAVSTPKWLIGFSDITALLWSLAQRGMGSLHGPVLTTLAQEPPESLDWLWHCLEGKTDLPPLKGNTWIAKPSVEGYLVPGNLTVATHLLGTAFQPNFQDYPIILALEDVGEAPYRIDRLLTQWRMLGILEQVKGIALGRFSQCEASPDKPSFSVETVLRDRLGDLDIPIVADLPFGHDGENYALPVGAWAALNSDRSELIVLR